MCKVKNSLFPLQTARCLSDVKSEIMKPKPILTRVRAFRLSKHADVVVAGSLDCLCLVIGQSYYSVLGLGS